MEGDHSYGDHGRADHPWRDARLFFGNAQPVSLALSLSFASGAMLYVVFGELLPESILMWRSKAPAFAMLVGLLVGVIILFV